MELFAMSSLDDLLNMSLPSFPPGPPPLSSMNGDLHPLQPQPNVIAPKGNPPPRGLPPPIRDSDSFIDETLLRNFELIINCVLINIISLLGSFGNIVCLYILYLHGLRNSSTNVILFSLAIVDLLILITLPLRKISLMIEPFDKALSITVESHVVAWHFLTLNRVWSLTSNAHVTLIAVERFLAVYFPFKVSVWTTVPRITFTVIFLHVAFYPILIPMFSMFKLIHVFDDFLNTTIAVPGITDFYLEREEEFNEYISYGINLLLGSMFLAITCICSIGIGIKLVNMTKKRKLMTGPSASTNFENNLPPTSGLPGAVNSSKMSTNTTVPFHSVTSAPDNSSVNLPSRDQTAHAQSLTESENVSSMTQTQSHSRPITHKQKEGRNAPRADLKVIKMLFIVCLVYLVLIFPSFLLFVFQDAYEELREPYWRSVNFLATSVQMVLICLNSSLNFPIYVANSSKFYHKFVAIIACKKIKFNSK